MTIFHVVFLAGLAFILGVRWLRTGGSWSPGDSALLLLVIAQVGLYVRFFIWPSPLVRPASWTWWGVYFVLSFAIWLAEWRLEPNLEWVVLAYLGQMVGVLPPRASLPATALVAAVYFGIRLGWDELGRLNPWQLFGGLTLFTAWTALGMFLHRLTVTSSERAALIEKLETARQELERARERHAELAALRERERMARDLHDSLGHALVTLSVQLEAVQRLYPADPGKAAALLDDMKALTRGTMESLRRSLANLRAPGLGDEPLGQALERLCRETAERAGMKVACRLPADLEGLRVPVAEVLWRVAHEAIINVQRHAQAQTVELDLQREPQALVLRVSDDGVGLPEDAATRPGHFGLRGLRERLEGLGGELVLARAQPRGTRLEARIPMLAKL